MPRSSSERTRVRRLPKRGFYDRESIDAILDEALVCHVGLVDDGQPFVIPTLHARVGDTVYVHGSSASRLVRSLSDGVPACLTATVIDGLVLARSAFHHSMNYRSVVLVGTARAVEPEEERLAAMRAFTERMVPGRWDAVRGPTRQELKATRALAFPIDEASAKVRTGPAIDDEEDYELDVWAGVIPLALRAGEPVPDPRLKEGVEVPDHVARRHRDLDSTGGR